jgi:hypothetical protein
MGYRLCRPVSFSRGIEGQRRQMPQEDFSDDIKVIGTDLSAIQPDWVPPNCRFEIDDAEQDWTFDPNLFDFIHNRNFICAIRNWPKLIAQTYKYCSTNAPALSVSG